jgi:nitrogen fixation-related uncharacterized protein
MSKRVSDNRAVAAARPGPITLDLAIAIGLGVIGLLAFYFSTTGKHQHFDYTYRVAGAFMNGEVGLKQLPPSWLNEFVNYKGEYYSVFPLGAVLSMLPLAVLQKMHLLNEFRGRVVAAIVAGASVFFFYQLSAVRDISMARRIMLALFPVFGTWTWTNLGFAGAWQIALGLALLGEAAALYFTLVKSRPMWAGVFFALAFGNRTEIILTAPIFLYFWLAPDMPGLWKFIVKIKDYVQQNWKKAAFFLAVPSALLFFTAIYNFARFESLTDFGYSRIPNLLNEPWYKHGVFSFHAIPWNAFKMLLEGVHDLPVFPYFQAYPFGTSIFLSSPFLFLLFREGGKYKAICWLAIGAMTVVLWCHGNPGGWQFSYRYGIILIPWMFLLILSNGPAKLSTIEVSLFVVSLAINAVSTYQFLWTDVIHP